MAAGTDHFTAGCDSFEALILTPAETMEMRDLVWHLAQVLGHEHPGFPLIERMNELLYVRR